MKIAITQRLVRHNTYIETRECLDIRWAKLFNALGFIPVILPLHVDVQQMYEQIGFQGIILSGGNDLYTLNNNELSLKRDGFEKKILHFAIEKDMPLLGVCRGMQLIAHYFGSTLKQAKGQIGIRDTLHVKKDSKYKKILKEIKEVNSYANYFIDRLSDDLRISATGTNQLVRAIEHKRYNIMGVMWHSEREEPFCDIQNAFIREFFSL